MCSFPSAAQWILAVASTDGTRGVNVLVHDSVQSVRDLFATHVGATTPRRSASRRTRRMRSVSRCERPHRAQGPVSFPGQPGRASPGSSASTRSPAPRSACSRPVRSPTSPSVFETCGRASRRPPTRSTSSARCRRRGPRWPSWSWSDEGRVDLDEPVRTYLPDFRVADADVSARLTPRHLLNHTNGIEES